MINKELADLYEKLQVATRVQSRELKDRILELESEKNHFKNENSRLDELIKKKQAHIVKLNEKLYKSSIKTTMLGQDA
jgi:predicted  nucleic acid-binding Zn-ribbon protein